MISRLGLLALLLAPYTLLSQPDTTQHVIADRKNAPENYAKPYVILISIDGMRADYAEKYGAPHLLDAAGKGVSAEYLLPAFPSLTFPNHYTLATGLYPAHHGIVHNYFYDTTRQDSYGIRYRAKVTDGTWYAGTPLWVLAEKSRLLSADFFWVGTEAAIQRIRPSYYYTFSDNIPVSRRIDAVYKWLSQPEDRRPHVISFYLSDVDHAGHDFGPDATETREAVHRVDSIIFQLQERLKSTGLPINYIVVADHGMKKIDMPEPLKLPAIVDTSRFVVPVSYGVVVGVYAKERKNVEPVYRRLKKDAAHYKAYRPGELYKGYKTGARDRTADIVLVADPGYMFTTNKVQKGEHGYDPQQVKEMRASFYAWGPAFKSGLRIPGFENVHVYPLIAQILGLDIPAGTDGKKEVLQGILR